VNTIKIIKNKAITHGGDRTGCQAGILCCVNMLSNGFFLSVVVMFVEKEML
jgi:hypothetical protein